jgi:hypothetical protein
MGILAVGQEPSRMVEVVADTRNYQADDDPNRNAGEAEERTVRQSRRLELRTVALARVEADECAPRQGAPLSRSIQRRFLLDSPVGIRKVHLESHPCAH